MAQPKPVVRPKSSWQKDDCIRSPACSNPSTEETAFGDYLIRHCTNERCRKFARDLAWKGRVRDRRPEVTS